MRELKEAIGNLLFIIVFFAVAALLVALVISIGTSLATISNGG